MRALLIFVLSFTAMPALAAEISFDAGTGEPAVGQQFKIDMVLNAGGEEINAIEGVITFPSDVLDLKEIKTANSIINFWLDQPKIKSDGRITFSGITPGGYRGQKGLLLSVVFVPKKEGQGIVKLHETKALLNDGKGTETPLSVSPYQFTISRTMSAPPVPFITDKEPPESFVPEIASTPILFDGKRMLVFATQDKKSGMDHYEVKETRQRIFIFGSPWITAESPYELKDQELRSFVLVKAVDKAGNARVVSVKPKNPPAWYENYENWIIILLAVSILSALKYRAWRKLKKA